MHDIPDARQRVRLSVRQVIWVLGACTCALMLIGLVREALTIALGVPSREFYLTIFRFDSEMTIPAWYSGALMLISGLMLFVCSAVARTIRSSEFIWWLILGVGFIYLSADEVVGIHERIGEIASRSVVTSGAFAFTWLVVGIPAVIAVAMLFLPFLLKIDRGTRWLLIASGALFVGGAVGFEMLGGLAVTRYGMDSPPFLVVSALEECLELAGMTLLIVTLLLRIRDDCRHVVFDVR